MSIIHGFRGLVYVQGVSLDTHSASIQRPFQLNATITPNNATNQNLVWTSSNTNIATVDNNGLVTPVGEGNCTITVTLDGHSDSCTFAVSQIHVTGVTLDKNSISVNVGETEQLTATVNPSDASNPNVTWSSSNTSIATVSSTGLVTAIGDGTVTITVTTQDGGYTATCSVECISFRPIDCCFAYTGAEQSITLQPHTYLLQVWGAEGGASVKASSGTCIPGKGGYSEGCITLSSPTCVYVYVGGQGGGCVSGGGAGFNGGGIAGTSSCSACKSGGGGGGTDIRIGGNTLCHRRIVAGGGGGKGLSDCSYGGVGGGCCGCKGYTNSSYDCRTGRGGTQTAGGATGSQGGNAGNFGNGGAGQGGCGGGAGGGGGWYGGGGGSCGSAIGGAGGGGSGYVYNSSTCGNTPSGYCHCTSYYLTNAYTCCGLCSFPSPSGSTETGHSGCGCVRIISL